MGIAELELERERCSSCHRYLPLGQFKLCVARGREFRRRMCRKCMREYFKFYNACKRKRGSTS